MSVEPHKLRLAPYSSIRMAGCGAKLTERLTRLQSFDGPLHHVSPEGARSERRLGHSLLVTRRAAGHPVAHAMPSLETCLRWLWQ